jgi:hypothetical protein
MLEFRGEIQRRLEEASMFPYNWQSRWYLAWLFIALGMGFILYGVFG